MPMSPAERSLRAKIAACVRWSSQDPKEGTKAARAGFEARFLREVDPDGVLPEAERRRRAGLAMSAHMLRLRLARMRKAERKKARALR